MALFRSIEAPSDQIQSDCQQANNNVCELLMNSEILKLLTETGKYLGKKRKSNLEVLARNLSLETSQNRVSGLTWYETNLLGRSFHVVQNLYYRCNDEDNRTNDKPDREKRFLDID